MFPWVGWLGTIPQSFNLGIYPKSHSMTFKMVKIIPIAVPTLSPDEK